MKLALIAVVLSLAVPTAFAQMSSMKGMDMKGMDVQMDRKETAVTSIRRRGL